jgi:transitional endoplasmic reticulum ATPase
MLKTARRRRSVLEFLFVLAVLAGIGALYVRASRAAKQREREQLRTYVEQVREAGAAGELRRAVDGDPYAITIPPLGGPGRPQVRRSVEKDGTVVGVSEQSSSRRLPGGGRAETHTTVEVRHGRSAPDLMGALRGKEASHGERFAVHPPDGLPTFDDVGGMEELKQELRETVGLLLAHPDKAAQYAITWNGLLLHGPPGTGKTFLARAIAGEFGLNLLHVSTGDLVEGVVGESARNVQRAFEAAERSRPCLLVFDEFDSIAQRRDAGSHAEERRTVNQLLTSLEETRDTPDLLIVAATNDLDHLDPAIIRPGRFDRQIRIDLPDLAARRAILVEHLEHRPSCVGVDLDDLARRTDGLTPAALVRLVDAAALVAFREASERGEVVEITHGHLESALRDQGGRDRPTVEDWDWDSLVLPPAIIGELRQLQAVVEDPDLTEALGVSPPSGVLLAGPPGTGKTTIGRILAAQARCSFYAVSAADVTSRWVGESEGAVKRLFERARANRPAIVFIDEIDAIGARRRSDTGDASARQLNQLLLEMDGIAGSRGILVIGATNRPELLDDALVRGGRLSRTIELTLPDASGRQAILELATARMPTVGVDLGSIAVMTDGFSGADLKAACQQAALHALVRLRSGDDPDAPLAVTQDDFVRAVADRRGSAGR